MESLGRLRHASGTPDDATSASCGCRGGKEVWLIGASRLDTLKKRVHCVCARHFWPLNVTCGPALHMPNFHSLAREALRPGGRAEAQRGSVTCRDHRAGASRAGSCIQVSLNLCSSSSVLQVASGFSSLPCTFGMGCLSSSRLLNDTDALCFLWDIASKNVQCSHYQIAGSQAQATARPSSK